MTHFEAIYLLAISLYGAPAPAIALCWHRILTLRNDPFPYRFLAYSLLVIGTLSYAWLLAGFIRREWIGYGSRLHTNVELNIIMMAGSCLAAAILCKPMRIRLSLTIALVCLAWLFVGAINSTA